MVKMSSLGACALLFISTLLAGLLVPGMAGAYRISYDHYVFATGNAATPPELDDGYLTNGPLDHYFSFTHEGETAAPNIASISYFADIDAAAIGAYASAVGGVTDFWPYGFTSTGRVEKIGFEVYVYYLVQAGEYPEGLEVSASGRVTGTFSSTLRGSAQGRYSVSLGAGIHSPPLVSIGNDVAATIAVDETFEVTHQIVAPGGDFDEPTTIRVTLAAWFHNMQTDTNLEGTSPNYLTGSAEDDFFSGLEFTQMKVPEGVTWTTDSGEFFTEESLTGAEDTPRAARLEGNHPNPFNPATTISYFLAEPGPVSLTVFDLTGKLVRVLDQGLKERGHHEKRWDGLDESGRDVPSGIYLYTLEAQGVRESKKMMLVR